MKKILALLLAALMIITAFAACGQVPAGQQSGGEATADAGEQGEKEDTDEGGEEAASEEVYTIRFFDKNSGTKTFGEDPVSVELMKRTGVKVEVVNPTGDPAEKLSLMLAANDYPDIVLMDRGSEIVNQYIEAGALIPISDYFDKMPNVVAMYGDVLSKSVYKDGKNYYLNNWYGVDPDPVNAFCMRYDLMIELLGQERADSDEPFEWDEFVQLLKDYKEKYPEIDGNETIPFIIPQPGTGEINGAFAGAAGLKNSAYIDDEGHFHFAVDDPQFMVAIHMMNELYREGLLDPEWTSNANELRNQKMSNTNVFGYGAAYWGAWTPNAALEAASGDPKMHYLAYKVLAPGVGADETTYSGRSTLGWDAIGVTVNCKNIDAVCKFIDYCASRDGQDLLLWGIQGKDWDIVDGKHTDIGGVMEAYRQDPSNYTLNSGICSWTWFVTNQPHDDGTATRIYYNEKDDTATFAAKNITNSAWDTADFAGLEPAGNTVEALQYQKLLDDFDQYYPKMVNAATVEECDSLYEEMIEKMNSDGKEDVEKYIDAEYQERVELWGLNK